MASISEGAEPLKFLHCPSAQTEFTKTLPLIANENAYLGDVYTSSDKTSPISCGFYRLEKGTPLVYTYTYHEMKIILEGEFIISDESGQEVHAKPGDVFHFPKGSVITFKTNSYGLAFFTGQRERDSG